MTLDYFIKKKNSSLTIRILIHVLFWFLVSVSSYFFIKNSYSVYKDTPVSYLEPIKNTIGLVVVFYPLMYVLIPQFLKTKQWHILILYVSTLIFLYVFIEALGEKMMFHFCDSCRIIAEDKNPAHLSVLQKGLIDNILYKASNIGLFFSLFSSLILPISIKSSLGYYEFYIKNLHLEKENAQLELNFLKAQVNPHFLFNTLNNLYGLILHKRTEASAETVTRLSDFMRYSLENANKKHLVLSEEIELIKNYIELEKLRLNYTKVVFVTNAEESDKKLPPLLFIPLIENAFKYNVDKKDTTIKMHLMIQDHTLEFSVSNTFGNHKTKNDSGGLGLSNLMKRLDLYFLDTYVYKVDIKNSIYKAYLKLDLK